MRLLLDTHVILWMAAAPHRIRPSTRAVLYEPNSELFVSASSVMEIASKVARGSVVLTDETLEGLGRQVRWLNVTPAHAWRITKLPLIHLDPFDRILVAQALQEGLTLVTGDRKLLQYAVPILQA